MTHPALPLHFEDVPLEATFTTAAKEIEEADVVAFAKLWDPQPFHLDHDAARDSIFGRMAASGLHTLSQTFRLYNDIGLFRNTALAGTAMDDVRWRRPVYIGDEIRVTIRIASVHPSSRGDRGRVRLEFSTRNQSDEVVLSFTLLVLVKSRSYGG